MKKVLFGLLIMLSLSMSATNSFDKTVDKTSNGVEMVYEDGREAVTTVYSDLKTIAPKISDGVKEVAKGLKVGAESVWDILVKQQFVWSLCFLILTLSALSNWFLFYKNTQKNNKNIEYVTLNRDIIGDVPNPRAEEYYVKRPNEYALDIRSKITIKGPVGKEEYSCPKISEGANQTLMQKIFKYIHLILCLTLSYFSFIHFADMLTGFINPEFGAIKTIATIVQNIK